MKVELKKASANVDDYELGDGLNGKIKLITKLYVEPEERGNGYASELMKEIANNADLNGHALIVEPNPFGIHGLDKSKLISFYAKHGFVRLQKEPYLMVRYPHEPKVTLKKTHYETQLAVKSIGA